MSAILTRGTWKRALRGWQKSDDPGSQSPFFNGDDGQQRVGHRTRTLSLNSSDLKQNKNQVDLMSVSCERVRKGTTAEETDHWAREVLISTKSQEVQTLYHTQN